METLAETQAAAANPFNYGTQIWELFRLAPRAGRFAPETPGVMLGKAGTPAAHSVLSLALQIDDGEVVDARFQAYGCPTSIAVGAWIADWAIGKRVAELAALTATHLRNELEIPDERAHCALLGEDALRAVVALMKQEPL